MVLGSVENYWSPVDALCQAMVAHFGYTFSINAYITPVNSQGFSPHSDHQDGEPIVPSSESASARC